MPVSRAVQAVNAARRAKLVQYRLDGRPYDDFYEELGYGSAASARKDFMRAIEESVAAQHASVEVYRETELLRLDGELRRLTALYERVEEILEIQHITVSQGRVVLHGGAIIPDWGPVLAAVDRLVRIDDARRKNSERRCKLLGLDAPQKLEVLTIDAIDQQIAALREQLAASDAEAGTPAGAQDAQNGAEQA